MRLLELADGAALAVPPNNSCSIDSGVIAAALTTMKGPFARADASWIIRAVSSLPAPE